MLTYPMEAEIEDGMLIISLTSFLPKHAQDTNFHSWKMLQKKMELRYYKAFT